MMMVPSISVGKSGSSIISSSSFSFLRMVFNPFSSQVLDLNALKTVIICIWGSCRPWFPACLTSGLGSIIRYQKEKERDVWTKGGWVWSLRTLKLEAWWVFWCFPVEIFDLWFYLIFMDEKVLIFDAHLKETQLKVWFFGCFLWLFCWFGIGFMWCLCVCQCLCDGKRFDPCSHLKCHSSVCRNDMLSLQFMFLLFCVHFDDWMI